jgi:hypothetical protein
MDDVKEDRMIITDKARRLYKVVMENLPEIRSQMEAFTFSDTHIREAAALCAAQLLDIGYVFRRDGGRLWVRLEYNEGTCQRAFCCGNDVETVFAALIAEKLADGTIAESAVLADKETDHEDRR